MRAPFASLPIITGLRRAASPTAVSPITMRTDDITGLSAEQLCPWLILTHRQTTPRLVKEEEAVEEREKKKEGAGGRGRGGINAE